MIYGRHLPLDCTQIACQLGGQCATAMEKTSKRCLFFYPRAKKVLRRFIEKQKFGNNILLCIVLSYIGTIVITFVLFVL